MTPAISHSDTLLSVLLKDEPATAAFAGRLALLAQPGDALLLAGDLGAGKSTFARSFIRTLAGDEHLAVPSPTFTLVQTYDTPAGDIWHMDCYRLGEAGEAEETGIAEAFGHAICLVEWPEVIRYLAPVNTLELRFSTIPDAEGRRLTLQPHGRWKTIPLSVEG